ncbi:MAG: hypothetical protein AM325_013065 [Candidatus Thorarchaeota archaeon SMTZ1-45]
MDKVKLEALPKVVEFRDELSLTPIMKIHKKVFRKEELPKFT